MKKSNILCASLALLTLLAACDVNNLDTSSTSSNTTSSSTTSSVVQEEQEYVIIARNYVGCTITTDKSKAKAGETVNVTVNLESGYTLKKILLNNDSSKLTKTSNTTYSFIMPNESAVLTAEISIEGDVIIQGSLAFALTLDETGVYSAKGVVVNDTAHLTYVVHNQSLTVKAIDNTKCFADINLNSGNKVGEFSLAGNAKYDFFYDPNNGETPCYIVRTEVLNAPTSVNSFQSLFSGSVRSEPTTYPKNVNKVTYTNSETGDNYVWENYENGSLAKSEIESRKTSYVYKSLAENNGKKVYTVVDDYIEGKGGNDDATRKDDTTAFSGRYDVVADYTEGYKKYQYLENDSDPHLNANFDAHHYSHDINSLDFDIHYGYRTGFDTTYNATLIDYKININSTTHEDNTFTTTILSYKTIDNTKDPQSGSSEKYHVEYKIEFKFTKAGAPLAGSYKETYYSNNAYDVDNKQFMPGGEELGKVTKEMKFTYSYGDAKAGEINFDTTPYFTTRLDDLKVNNPTAGEDNVVQQNDIVNNYVSFNVYPSTALDAWQYGIESSTNTSVVGPKSVYEPLTFKRINQARQP